METNETLISDEPSDIERIQSILNDIKNKANKNEKSPFEIEASAAELLISYIEESVHAILEEASLLARHRNSDIVDPADVQLILIKKYGIDIPGAFKSNLLHKQSYKSKLNSSTSRSILTSKFDIIASLNENENEPEDIVKKRGRKSASQSDGNLLPADQSPNTPLNKRLKKDG